LASGGFPGFGWLAERFKTNIGEQEGALFSLWPKTGDASAAA